MAVKVTMPKLGAAMTVGKIVEWSRGEGDHVEENEIILIVETEKVQYEVESPVSGILHILYPAEAEVEVGVVIGLIAIDKSEYDQLIAGAGLEEAERVPPKEIRQEPFSVSASSLEEAVSASAQGSRIRSTPKVRKLAKERGINLDLVEGTGPKGRITENDVLSFMERATIKPVEPEKQARISPVAKKMVDQIGLDIVQISGTGIRGRIVKNDVLREVGLEKVTPAQLQSRDIHLLQEKEDRLEKFTGMRKIIAEKMIKSKETAPHAYLDVNIDASALLEFRKELLPYIQEKAGVKVTITDILMKLTNYAINEHPIINTRYTDEGILWLADIHMGMAMDVENGLIVPVIRYIDKKPISQIAKERASLVERGRSGKLTPDDMSGSTFTFSSLGMFGIDHFTAIINQPESAILTVSAILEKPWAIEKQLAVRPIMNMSITVDHRVIYGADAARFMKTLKTFIENPRIVLA